MGYLCKTFLDGLRATWQGNQAEEKGKLSVPKRSSLRNWWPRVSVRVEGGEAWRELFEWMAPAFTAPSFALFTQLITAWVLLPGRHTITRMWRVMEPETRGAHDAYHRFVRCGRWSLPGFWHLLALLVVQVACPVGVIPLVVDDTVAKKTGRKISGAGIFRDAVRSTRNKVVYAWGLNIVLLVLPLHPPWGGEPLGLPVNLRIYRKNSGQSHLDLAVEMVLELAEWFPEHAFELCGDGAYAPLAGRNLPRTDVTSRLRRDAALYELPAPRRKGQRGRPRKKGPRLPALPQLAAALTQEQWTPTQVAVRGATQQFLLYTREVLWYDVLRDRPVLLVIIRDPAGVQPDDYFFTTNLADIGAQVASRYGDRWSIEDSFRSTKQFLGLEDPQTRKGNGPERAVALACWTYAAVWLWYIRVHGTERTWATLPWYSLKCTPSFPDALAALRRDLWRQRIFAGSAPPPDQAKIQDMLVEVLATAA